MKNICFLLFLFLYLPSNSQRVIDGDTFEYKGERYRLAYIDAPELSQPIVGQMSKEYLQRNLSLKGMRVISKDKYGRYIVVLGDLNYRMVLDGYSVVFKFFCRDFKYFRAEKEAKRQKKGIHKYNFINPQKYRKWKKH
jgi:endonuclease YncB( thermonuclease family)